MSEGTRDTASYSVKSERRESPSYPTGTFNFPVIHVAQQYAKAFMEKSSLVETNQMAINR